MKTQTQLFKLEQKQLVKTPLKIKIFNQDGNLSKAVYNAIRESIQSDNKIRPFKWYRNGKHINSVDNTVVIKMLLDMGGYKYTEGNDGSRLGREGQYLKVSKKALIFLLNLK